jgi:hypothetical protein
MILINKNSVNTCILTLSERTTLTNVKYLFEFTNDSTKQTKTFLCADVSTNKLRYNEFLIEENTTENLLIGKVSLTIGDWKYNIYEQTSTTNLVVANSGALVENGKIEVKGTSTDLAEFTSEQTIYKEFNG